MPRSTVAVHGSRPELRVAGVDGAELARLPLERLRAAHHGGFAG